MTIPAKIETTLRNLTPKNWSQASGGTVSDCKGGRCFLEQYALDHIDNSWNKLAGGGIYIDWCVCGDDPDIIDLAYRLDPRIKDQHDITLRRSDILAAIYRINDDRTLNLEQVKDKIREAYN